MTWSSQIYIIGHPWKEEREWGKKTSEEIMTENCPKVIKEFNALIPEDQWKLNRRNAKKTTLRHLYNQIAGNQS